MSAIVVVKSRDGEEQFHYGPFTNQEQASGWAIKNCPDHEYEVKPMWHPGTTYTTCSMSDVVDFIQSNSKAEVMVTIDDVNWCVINKEG